MLIGSVAEICKALGSEGSKYQISCEVFIKIEMQ